MTRIFIEGYELDLTEGLTNQITYAIDDIQNLDSKSTSFTKTIVLPGTANNNKLLGNIFEFNSSNFYNPASDNVLYNFNAAVNANARIELNGLQIMKGVLRLIEIVQNGDAVEYECAIFGELGGFITALGNNRLEDLDFSAYNHTYNASSIVGSWTNTPGSGYCYPLIDYGNVSTGVYGTAKKDFQYTTFKPALYVKEYLDKIFQAAGYTYECPFFSEAKFKRLIIPNNQAVLQKNSNVQLEAMPELLQYTGSGSTTFNLSFVASTLGSFTLTSSNTLFTYTGTSKAVNINLKVVGIWNIGNAATIKLRKNGTSVASQYIGAGFSTNYFNVSLALTNNTINNGDTFQVSVEWSGAASYDLSVLDGSLDMSTTTSSLVPINYGESLPINNTIPKGIFQKDFFISILKMFNLLVTEDKYKKNHLIISPYIDFWDGSQLDWSNKLDREKVIKQKPMSEINARYYNLKYKQDNDYYNEEYRKKYSEGYGDRIYDNGLEFVKDTEQVEVIFSASVLYNATGQDKVFPAIYKKSNENTKEDPMDHNVRIMQTSYQTGVASWTIYNGATSLGSRTDYLYAGHLDDPDAPTQDINFGAPQQLYFTLATGDLSNNLFNTYYSSYLAEITDKDSRLLTGYFKLTDQDIFNLNFGKYIYIDGGLYRLSRVIDFTPEANDLTKVELLRVIEKNTATYDATPQWASQNYNTCVSCGTYVVYRDVNPYSATYNEYRVNGVNVGLTPPTNGACNTAANWVSQSYSTCYNCVDSLVYRDTNPCSPTYNNYRTNGVNVGNTAPTESACDFVPNWVSQSYYTCSSCNTYLVYRDTKPCSPTYNQYRVNGYVVGYTAPTNGSCNTSAQWTSQGYNTCSGCVTYLVYRDTNPCSSTYLNYRVNGVNVGNSAPSNGDCNYSAVLTNQGYSTCIGCSTYIVYKDTNPCSATYNRYFVGGVDKGTGMPTPGPCDTSSNWVDTGYTFCSNCVNKKRQEDIGTCSPTKGQTRDVNGGSACNYNAVYNIPDGYIYTCSGGSVNSLQVWKNSNSCFTGDQWYTTAGGGTTYSTRPSNSYPDTTPNWQPNGSNYCSGKDLVQPQKDTNVCSATYNNTRDQIIEYNSNTCAEVYVLSDCLSGGTGFSIVYVKNAFAVGDRVTSSGVTFVITSVTTTGSAGSYVLSSTGQTGCPEYTQFIDRCNGDAPYYMSGTGMSGRGYSSDVNSCLQVTGTTSSPSGTQIYNWYSDPGCECV